MLMESRKLNPESRTEKATNTRRTDFNGVSSNGFIVREFDAIQPMPPRPIHTGPLYIADRFIDCSICASLCTIPHNSVAEEEYGNL